MLGTWIELDLLAQQVLYTPELAARVVAGGARMAMEITTHPAGRVKDLKDRGYHIRRTMVNDIDAAGVEHRVAEYCLCSEKGAKQWA